MYYKDNIFFRNNQIINRVATTNQLYSGQIPLIPAKKWYKLKKRFNSFYKFADAYSDKSPTGIKH